VTISMCSNWKKQKKNKKNVELGRNLFIRSPRAWENDNEMFNVDLHRVWLSNSPEPVAHEGLPEVSRKHGNKTKKIISRTISHVKFRYGIGTLHMWNFHMLKSISQVKETNCSHVN
jgi:hypothetical protein